MELDLAAIVNDVLKTLGNNLVENGIELIRELREVPPLRSDKPKVMQILANLVTNAIHALLSTNYSLKRLTVRVDREGDDRVYVEVEDTGIGIDAVHLSRIFQYGFTTKLTGHGFGLHHSVLVARELGGDLKVHSDGIGRGARFTLELPVCCAVEVCQAELVGV
jgi:signal transduction histidine kinase